MAKIKCALVGCGYWGKIIKKYIEAIPDLELVQIFDRNNDPFNQKICPGGIEAVFICLPTELHYKYSKFFLLQGIHVFCEKPLTLSLSETLELIELAKRSGLIVYTDYPFSFSPSMTYLIDNISNLGQKKFIKIDFEQFGLFYPNEDVFDTIGPHPLSLLWRLCRPKSNQFKVENIDVILKDKKEDILAANIRFSLDGLPGNLEVSLISDQKKRKFILHCEKGHVIYDMTSKQTAKIISYDLIGRDCSCYEITKTFDESNNVLFSIKQFIEFLKNPSDKNYEETIFIASSIQRMKDISYRGNR